MFTYLKKCIFSVKDSTPATRSILDENTFYYLNKHRNAEKKETFTASGLVRGFLSTARKSLTYRASESRVLHSFSGVKGTSAENKPLTRESVEKLQTRKAGMKGKLLEKASCYKALCDTPVVDLGGEATEQLRRKSRILLKLYLEDELYRLLVWTGGGQAVLEDEEFNELMQSRGGMEVFWPSLLKVAVLRHLLRYGRLQELAAKYRELAYLKDGSDKRSVRRAVAAFMQERNPFELEWGVYSLFSPETKHFVFFSLPQEFRCGIPSSEVEASSRKEHHLPKEIASYIVDVIESEVMPQPQDAARSAKAEKVSCAAYYEDAIRSEFSRLGWNVRPIYRPESDGLDLLIDKSGLKGLVQCRSADARITTETVQEAYAAKEHYKADFAAIVSALEYSRSPCLLAGQLNVFLLHESELADCEQLCKVFHFLS